MSPKLSVRKERDNRRRGSSKIDQAGRDEIDKNIILSKRLGLDYGKLFRDDEGGYDVETLQTALDKMQADQKLGIYWNQKNFVSGNLRKRLESSSEADALGAISDEEAQEEAEEASDDEDGEKLPTWQ